VALLHYYKKLFNKNQTTIIMDDDDDGNVTPNLSFNQLLLCLLYALKITYCFNCFGVYNIDMFYHHQHESGT
jgi:hypothetical protein